MSVAINWTRVESLWASSGRTGGTIGVYRYWARRFVDTCSSLGLDPIASLSLSEVQRIATFDPPRRGAAQVGRNRISAVRAMSCALARLGYDVPVWYSPPKKERFAPLIERFVADLMHSRGVVEKTGRFGARCATRFTLFLRARGRSVRTARIVDIDAYVLARARVVTPKTMSGECSSLRSFLRFVHRVGLTRMNLAVHVASPRVRSVDRPPRAVPWSIVRRIVHAIDASTPLGMRDKALFLMMASYGMGASETLALRLDDIEWRGRHLRVSRPKTGVTTELPLLAPVAHALAVYVRKGRPAHASTRAVFVSDHLPHGPLSGSTAIRHRLALYAARAGIREGYLGTHLFRHSHATREIEQGRSAKVVGDILGHRRPESTSVYIRSAVPRLRTIALPVPR